MLTALQADVLAYLIEFRNEHQMPPTRAQITERFGWQYPSAAQSQLKALERKGYIRITPTVARGIFVIRETADEAT